MKLNLTNLTKTIKHIKKSGGVSKDGLDLTIGYDPIKKNWDYQTGDNSYTGACYFYPIWGVTTIFPKSKSKDLAKELINQILDQSDYHAVLSN